MNDDAHARSRAYARDETNDATRTRARLVHLASQLRTYTDARDALVIALHNDGESIRNIAVLADVSPTVVVRILKSTNNEGNES